MEIPPGRPDAVETCTEALGSAALGGSCRPDRGGEPQRYADHQGDGLRTGNSGVTGGAQPLEVVVSRYRRTRSGPGSSDHGRRVRGRGLGGVDRSGFSDVHAGCAGSDGSLPTPGGQCHQGFRSGPSRTARRHCVHREGQIDWLWAIPLSVGSIVGSRVGAMVSLGPHASRWVYSMLLVVLAGEAIRLGFLIL